MIHSNLKSEIRFMKKPFREPKTEYQSTQGDQKIKGSTTYSLVKGKVASRVPTEGSHSRESGTRIQIESDEEGEEVISIVYEEKGVTIPRVSFFCALITLPNFFANVYYGSNLAQKTALEKTGQAALGLLSDLINLGVTHRYSDLGLRLYKQDFSQLKLDRWLVPNLLKSGAPLALAGGASWMYVPCYKFFPAPTKARQITAEAYGLSNVLTFTPMHLAGALSAREAFFNMVKRFFNYVEGMVTSNYPAWIKKNQAQYVALELADLLEDIRDKYIIDSQFQEAIKEKFEPQDSLELKEMVKQVICFDAEKFYDNSPEGLQYQSLKNRSKAISFVILPVATAGMLVWMSYGQSGYWLGSEEAQHECGVATIVINMALISLGASHYPKVAGSYLFRLRAGRLYNHWEKPFDFSNDSGWANLIYSTLAIVLGVGAFFTGEGALNLIHKYIYNPDGSPQVVSSTLYQPMLNFFGTCLFNLYPNMLLFFLLVENQKNARQWLNQRLDHKPELGHFCQTTGKIFQCSPWALYHFGESLLEGLLLIMDCCTWIPEQVFLRVFKGILELMKKIPSASLQHQDRVRGVKAIDCLQTQLLEAEKKKSGFSAEVILEALTPDSTDENNESTIISQAIQNGFFAGLTRPKGKTDFQLPNLNTNLLEQKNQLEDKSVDDVKAKLESFGQTGKTKHFSSDPSQKAMVAERVVTTLFPLAVGIALLLNDEKDFDYFFAASVATHTIWSLGNHFWGALDGAYSGMKQPFKVVAPAAVGLATQVGMRWFFQQIPSVTDDDGTFYSSALSIPAATVTSAVLGR